MKSGATDTKGKQSRDEQQQGFSKGTPSETKSKRSKVE